MSDRSTARTADISKNTVIKLLVDAGKACSTYQHHTLLNLPCKRIQVDEIWAFVYANQGNVLIAKNPPQEAGDVWTWTAICTDTKLVPYGSDGGTSPEKRYSPVECTGTRKMKFSGKPNDAHISSSYIERNKLTMRMSMRWFTRLTNAFSKKIENHAHSVSFRFTSSIITSIGNIKSWMEFPQPWLPVAQIIFGRLKTL